MKKFISLLLCFSVISCFLCSCGDTSCDNPDCTCGDTSTEQWQPRADEPWNFTPGYYGGAVIEPEDIYEFDYELALKQTEFHGVPEYLEIEIMNKTGDPASYKIMFIEKHYSDIYNIDDPYKSVVLGAAGNPSAWVRIPFMTEEDCLEVDGNISSGKIYLQENLKAAYEFTPGAYRLVVPLCDGTTRYLEFSIYEE